MTQTDMQLDTFYNEDCLITTARMPDNFLDLTVTSPPYDDLRTYNGFSFDFEKIAKELYRVTKVGGVIVWIVGDATIAYSETGTSFNQALFFKSIGFNLHDTMIWRKQSPPILKIVKRYQPNFEYMFILTKGRTKTFNAQLTRKIYEDKRQHMECHRNRDGSRTIGKSNIVTTHRPLDNVWDIPTGGGHNTLDGISYDHPAVFPEKLSLRHILSWSNPQDIVYDPFSGSGTTAVMAALNDRHFIASEISAEYHSMSLLRLQHSKLQLKLI